MIRRGDMGSGSLALAPPSSAGDLAGWVRSPPQRNRSGGDRCLGGQSAVRVTVGLVFALVRLPMKPKFALAPAPSPPCRPAQTTRSRIGERRTTEHLRDSYVELRFEAFPHETSDRVH